VTLPPDYELLGELGRGGMGVVYQAVQKGLNRVVALKMILAGEYAGADMYTRFLAEAEALAKIRHPGIVQVYDFGTFQGRPYFAMEYVAGGPLDRYLNATPQPPREAAALLAQLADAVQAAHQAGVVHRDLKPANVLLQMDDCRVSLENKTEDTRPSPSALGNHLSAIPKITDFGLAKQASSHLTASGAVMGTPSYMAPEQAEGKKQITPATDVYALGAILYECLTGRPPFKAATPLDTILQALSEEPVPPRRLQPTIPKDLETICLKCLHKDPNRRYLRAADLAADLRAYLEDRPITARPVGQWERAQRWCRRNPVIAGLAGALLFALIAGLASITLLYFRAEDQAAMARQERDERSRALGALQEEERKTRAARDNERRLAYYQAITAAHFAGKAATCRKPAACWLNARQICAAGNGVTSAICAREKNSPSQRSHPPGFRCRWSSPRIAASSRPRTISRVRSWWPNARPVKCSSVFRMYGGTHHGWPGVQMANGWPWPAGSAWNCATSVVAT
jgi:hypothetical protein